MVMSKGLSVHINNYKAILKADVELDDLTVLCGVNASGKSTIARMFHRLVCVEANYVAYAQSVVVGQFIAEVITPLKNALKGANPQLSSELCALGKQLQKEKETDFEKKVKIIREAFDGMFSRPDVVSLLSDKRLLDALDRRDKPAFSQPIKVSDVGVRAWLEDSLKEILSQYERLMAREEGSAYLFLTEKFPGDYFDPMLVLLSSMKNTQIRLSDGDVDLVDSSRPNMPFRPIFTPRQSFYIAQPAVDFPRATGNKIVLNGIEYGRSEDEQRGYDLRIEDIMGGMVKPQNENTSTEEAGVQWQFWLRGGTPIPVAQCAEGVKSLSALVMLDKLGMLGADSLLIIDEPEVHLHPQWVVEMARVLVLLAKYRKVRVLATTHSPDLVHALRDFAENENFDMNTRFYLAAEDKTNTGMYVYKDLGMDIGPIFTEFNLAKDRIFSVSKEMREGIRA